MNCSPCNVIYLVLLVCNHLQSVVSASLKPEDAKSLPKSNSQKILQDTESDNDLSKRGWKDNTMQVWGKRNYNHDDLLQNEILLKADDDNEHIGNTFHDTNVKRKWGQNNIPVWGKRGTADSDAMTANALEFDQEDSFANTKRKWDGNSMTVWGKRDDAKDESLPQYNKRKWGANSMTVWGKRSQNPLQYSNPIVLESKRKWGDNSMSVWGKRSPSDSDVTSLESGTNIQLQPAGSDSKDSAVKRKWSDNTMQVWGKRNDDNSNNKHHHTVSKRSLEGLRNDYDVITEDDLLSPSNEDLYNALLLPKRSWETNTMRVWGKRNRPYRPVTYQYSNWGDDGLYSIRSVKQKKPAKHGWSSENELRVWG